MDRKVPSVQIGSQAEEFFGVKLLSTSSDGFRCQCSRSVERDDSGKLRPAVGLLSGAKRRILGDEVHDPLVVHSRDWRNQALSHSDYCKRS